VFAAAVSALAEALEFEQPADGLLSRYFHKNRGLGVRDRGFVAEAVYGVLRHRRFLTEVARADSPERLLLGFLSRFGNLSDRELQAYGDGRDSKWVERTRAIDLTALPLAIAIDWPDWLFAKVQGQMSDAELGALGTSLQQRAPMDLRVNTLLATREEALLELARDGIAATPTPYSPIGIRLAERTLINRHPLFIAGALEVQDEGSQLLGYLVAPKPTDMVVDFCAGGGGKTLLLGALMRSRGRIYALDVSDQRLRGLRPRLRRSGLSNVYPQRIASENDVRIKRLAAKIDRVLVDAPCSGTGTLRRNPDLKWRQSPESVDRLRTQQLSILDSAARLLKPRGRLVYATCSLLREENQDVVAEFLDKHADFRLVPASQVLLQQHLPLTMGEVFQLLPHRHDTDGFFAAILERNRAEAG
jgi:16S rRNA (cytosine967-C5)-methyltransferase